MKPFFVLLAIGVVGLTSTPTCAKAQRVMRPFTIEASGTVGGTFDFPGATAYSGLCITGTANCNEDLHLGRKSSPVFGGELAVALNRFIWLYGDYLYALPDRQTSSAKLGGSSGVTTVDRHYWISTGGVEVSFPTVHRIVPLLRVGAGEIHHSYNFDNVNVNATPAIVERSDRENIAAGTVAGGIRWYLGEKQGLRVLVSGYYLAHGIEEAAAPISGTGVAFISRRSGGAVTVSYFHQFGGRKPVPTK